MRACPKPPTPRPRDTRARAAGWGLLAALALGACGPRAPELRTGQATVPLPLLDRTATVHNLQPDADDPRLVWASTGRGEHLALLDPAAGWAVRRVLHLPSLGLQGWDRFCLRGHVLYVFKPSTGDDTRCLLQSVDLRDSSHTLAEIHFNYAQQGVDSLRRLWLLTFREARRSLAVVDSFAFVGTIAYPMLSRAPRAFTLPCLARLPLADPPRVEPLPVYYPPSAVNARPHVHAEAPGVLQVGDSLLLLFFPYDPVVLAYRPRSGALDTLGRAHCPGVAPRTDWTPVGAVSRDSFDRSAHYRELFRLPASGRFARLHYLGLDTAASRQTFRNLGHLALALYDGGLNLLRVDSLPPGSFPFGTFQHGDTLYVYNVLDNPSFPIKPLRYRTYWWGP